MTIDSRRIARHMPKARAYRAKTCDATVRCSATGEIHPRTESRVCRWFGWNRCSEWNRRGHVMLLGLSVIFVGCSSPLETYSGYLPPREYAIPCSEAYVRAARALKANGYRISEVERREETGVIVGLREAKRSQRMEMRITCRGTGASVSPSADSPYAENAMRIAFERAGELSEGARRRGTQLAVEAELVADPETKLYFDRLLGPFGAVALRVSVTNGTPRVVDVSPRAIGLRGPRGAVQEPLESSEVERTFATSIPKLVPRLLRESRLRSGDSVEGFLLYPNGRYLGAVLRVIDTETGEPEEFEIRFLQ